MSRQRQSRGFTLVEALATLLLVAIVLPVAMRGISVAMSAAANAAERTKAIGLAESKLAELAATGDWQGADLAGDFGESPSGRTIEDNGSDAIAYEWKAAVDDWLDVSVNELTVTVSWQRNNVDHSVTLVTLVRSEGL